MRLHLWSGKGKHLATLNLPNHGTTGITTRFGETKLNNTDWKEAHIRVDMPLSPGTAKPWNGEKP